MNVTKPREKKIKVIAGIAVSVLLVVSFIIGLGLTSKGKQGYRTISVVEVSGRVSVVKGDIEYSAYPGMLLQEGHEVITSGDSYVRLVLDEDKYVKLEEGCRLIFETVGVLGSGKTALTLERGALTTELVSPLKEEEQYVINTPNAVLAVRGTFFRVDLRSKQNGDIITDVKTYGGKVASKRVLPTGAVVEEEILIDAGYKACINMTKEYTHYIVEDEVGMQLAVDPSGVENGLVPLLECTSPIEVETISNQDLIDLFFSVENGHELFITAEALKENMENRGIHPNEQVSVYEKADEVRKMQREALGVETFSETINISDYIDDNHPLSESEQEDVQVYEDEVTQESMPITDGTGHVHEQMEFRVEPGCLEPGRIIVSCRTCDEVIEEKAILPKGHSFGEWTVWLESTCTEGGRRQSSCSVCGETVNETISALGHDYGTHFVVDTAATCMVEGSMSKHCSRCNSVSEVTAFTATGHVYGEWKTEQVATCVSTGKRARICNICGRLEEETTPVTGHSYGQMKVTQAATCTASGIQEKVCNVCKNTVRETIAATGHRYGEFATKKEASCTEEGSKEKECSVCGDTVEESIPMAEHVFKAEHEVDVEATCTTEGSKSRHCANCSATTDKETIPLAEHSYGEFITTREASCTEEGSKEKECSVCGDKVEESIPMSEHDYKEEFEVDVEATCTATGSQSRHCANCSATTDEETIPMAEHSYDEDFSVDKEATCTTDGSKSKHCTGDNCDATTEVTVIPAGHSYSEWDVTQEATCTTAGSQKKVCSGCGDLVEETIGALGHTDEDSNNICDNCDGSYVAINDINFPDAAFMAFVKDYDEDEDTYLFATELEQVTTMNLDGTPDVDGGYSSLEGIRYFTELTELTCSYNSELTALDVSAADDLSVLNISNTSIADATDIAVSESARLTELYMNHTNIAFASVDDVLWMGDLEVLEANDAGLRNVEWNDVVKRILPGTLRELQLVGNDRNANPDEFISMDMDMSKFGSLEYLDLSHNADMSGLSLDASSTLKMLNIAGTGIQELNVDSYSVLDSLTISNEAGTCAQLRTIDVDKCTSLETLDVSGCSALSELNAMDCTGLVTLDITGCTGLKTMELGGCTVLSDLDVAGHTGLEVLNVGYCEALTELDVSGCSSLYMLANEACNNVTSMNLDGTSLSSFYNLYCNLTELRAISAKNANLNGTDMATMTRMLSSKLERLDVEGNTIEYVDFGGKDVSNLKYLNLANNAELTQVSMYSFSGLEELDLSGTGVDYLTLSSNTSLKKLDVSDCTNMTGISVDGCSSLTELNLTNCNALQQLDVSGSGLEFLELNNMSNLNRLTLNRSGMTNTAMKELSLMDVGLTSLEIAGMSNLQKVQVSGDFLSMVTITDSSIKSELIMSDSPELIALITTNAYIKRIEATGCSLLSEFRVPGSGAEEITFVDCPNLQIVDVSSSAITTLNLPGSEYPYLASLNASYCNALTTVELQGGTALAELDVLSCPVLASINISGCTGQLSVDVRGVNGSDDVPAELEVNVSDTYLTENNFTKSDNLTLKLVTN